MRHIRQFENLPVVLNIEYSQYIRYFILVSEIRKNFEEMQHFPQFFKETHELKKWIGAIGNIKCLLDFNIHILLK